MDRAARLFGPLIRAAEEMSSALASLRATRRSALSNKGETLAQDEASVTGSDLSVPTAPMLDPAWHEVPDHQSLPQETEPTETPIAAAIAAPTVIDGAVLASDVEAEALWDLMETQAIEQAHQHENREDVAELQTSITQSALPSNPDVLTEEPFEDVELDLGPPFPQELLDAVKSVSAPSRQAEAPGSAPAPLQPVTSAAVVALSGMSDDVEDQFIQDPELVAIVVEEMSDLMPEIQDLLDGLPTLGKDGISNLHRLVHTLKGTVGQVGAYRARAVIHKMETVMEDLDEGRRAPAAVAPRLLEMYEAVHVLVRPLITGEWAQPNAPSSEAESKPSKTVVAVQPRPSVKVAADQVDRMILDVDQTRLAGLAQDEAALAVRQRLREIEEVAQRASLLLRELEIQSEIQMQSRQVAASDTVGFDPLELDRFTRLQELARLTGEAVADVLEVRRDLMRLMSQQDAARARAGRYMQGVASALHRARLTPADAINDRMHNVVWSTARELGKDVSFELVGARVEVDRLLLEKILGPLDHVLRNSVAHGIEPPDVRQRAGKPRRGLIKVTVKTAAGRAIIEVSDDGAGLNTDRIRQKAIEKGMWPVDHPMNDEQAAEMVCTPGFSTAEQVSQIAGRGVGMDAVRNSVLGMGGRFTMVSRPGQGLDVFISIPTAVASASVLLVEDGGEPWALPIDVIEHVVLAPRAWLDAAHKAGHLVDAGPCPPGWEGTEFRRLSDVTGVSISALPPSQSPLLLLRENGKSLAVEVSRLSQVLEATLSPPGPVMMGVRGVAGALVLPSGAAALLLDPFRAPPLRVAQSVETEPSPTVSIRPMIMVVDDSLTVRKAAIRFLNRHGYDHAQARDGQEALELLERLSPAAVILDVEMPRMDGFACAQAIRENPRTAHLPIIMVTSRTADKHRQRAMDIGVNAYLGKPFKDDDLARALATYIPRQD